MSVTVEDFSRWAFKDLEKVSGHTGKERSTWILLARFCCTRFINDTCYLPGDKSTMNQLLTHPRENDLSFVQVSFCHGACKLKDYRIISLQALQNIVSGEELYIKFGSK